MAELPSLAHVPDITPATTAASTPAPPTPVASPAPESGLSDNKKEKVPDGYAAPCRKRPATSKCLDKHFSEANGMLFPNIATAMAVMSPAQWRSPINDATMPQTQEQHRYVARLLTDAFKDMSMAKDTADNAYRKRLTPSKKEYYNDWAIENCAWHLVYMVKDMHINGFKIPIYDRALVDSIGQTQLWTFEERIQWICLVLKTSKSVAATLMKHEKVWTTIGAPHKLYNSTIVNTESNANRNRWVKDGRARDLAHAPRQLKNAESSQAGIKRRRPEDDTTVVVKIENDSPPAPLSILVTDTNMNTFISKSQASLPIHVTDSNMNATPAPFKRKYTRLPRNALGFPVLSSRLAAMPMPVPPTLPSKQPTAKPLASKFPQRSTIQALLNPIPTDQERPVRRASAAADTVMVDRPESVPRDAEEMDVAITLAGMGDIKEEK